MTISARTFLGNFFSAELPKIVQVHRTTGGSYGDYLSLCELEQFFGNPAKKKSQESDSKNGSKGQNKNEKCILSNFTCLVFAKHFLQTSLVMEAAVNDRELYRTLLEYRKVDPVVVFEALQVLRDHSWNLSEPICIRLESITILNFDFLHPPSSSYLLIN